jgi:hypothetical protein
MSTCISERGEYSHHTPDDAHVCTRCHVLDEDAVIQELKRLREERAQFDAWAEQLRYERRLLGSARMTLDLICDPENTHQSELQIRLLREEAGRTAQRIVDEIGHPVTDEPALGPEFRERIAELEAQLAELTRERHEATARLEGSRQFIEDETNRFHARVAELQAVVEAAREVVYCWKAGRLDHYVGIAENTLSVAVDALAASDDPSVERQLTPTDPPRCSIHPELMMLIDVIGYRCQACGRTANRNVRFGPHEHAEASHGRS